MIGGALRRAFSVAIYPRHGGRALVIHHRRLGVWLPPGGECEPGETPLEAAARELREETGLSGHFPVLSDIEGTPPGLIGYEEHVAGGKGLHMNFVFVADVGSTEVRPNREFTEHRWVESMDGLEAPPNVGQLLAVALTAQPPMGALARQFLAAINGRDRARLAALYADDAGAAAEGAWAPLLAAGPLEPQAILAQGERALLVCPGVVVLLEGRGGQLTRSRVYRE